MWFTDREWLSVEVILKFYTLLSPADFYFVDIEQGFMPWLIDQVQEQLQKSQLGRLVLDGIIRDVMNQRIDAYNKSSKPGGGGGAQPGSVSDNKSADGSNNAAAPQDPATATTSEVSVDMTRHTPRNTHLYSYVSWQEKHMYTSHAIKLVTHIPTSQANQVIMIMPHLLFYKVFFLHYHSFKNNLNINYFLTFCCVIFWI